MRLGRQGVALGRRIQGERENKRAWTCFLLSATALLDDTTCNQIVNIFNTPRLQNFECILAGSNWTM
ncbi:MAG: hypothetical protein EBW19_12895 [Betaproteobacteria bacterium]|nr:hypothetical protein [Betaproteobacteria bacterium]